MSSSLSSSPVKVGVVGYGGAFNMGRQHLQEMRAAGMVPTAVAELDPARLAVAQQDFPGIETYATLPEMLARSGVPRAPDPEVLELLVTCFRELREAVDTEGTGMERLSSVMSTAEAVSVAHAIGVKAHFLRGDAGQPEDIVACLAGTAAKDDAEDLARLRRYLDQRVSRRSGAAWRAFYAARHLLTPQ